MPSWGAHAQPRMLEETLEHRDPFTSGEIYSPIQKELAQVETVLRRELSSDNTFVQSLLEHASKLQGKLIRPALLLYSARIFGDATELHVGLSAVVQLVHNATLAHDDVLDEASLRRNNSSLNTMWGNEASVLFGDYLFAKAFELCARLDNTKANIILAETTQRICEGELSQIARKFQFDMEEEEYLDIIRHKTASLFAAACRLGTIGSTADADTVDALVRYGLHSGTAFQIADDCLDLTGSESEVGKSLGTDLERGKVTLPVLLLLRSVSKPKRNEIQALISSPNGVADKRTKILPLLHQHGIVEAVMRRAHDFVEEARAALRNVRDSVFVANLHSLAGFAVERSR